MRGEGERGKVVIVVVRKYIMKCTRKADDNNNMVNLISGEREKVGKRERRKTSTKMHSNLKSKHFFSEGKTFRNGIILISRGKKFLFSSSIYIFLTYHKDSSEIISDISSFIFLPLLRVGRRLQPD